MERTSYKSRDLVYETAGHKLVVYLEMSGVTKFDWVGKYSDFQNWTAPRMEQIPEEQQAEILLRLLKWSEKENVCIALEEQTVDDAWLSRHEKLGFTVEALEHNTVIISTRPRRGIFARILSTMFSDK